MEIDKEIREMKNEIVKMRRSLPGKYSTSLDKKNVNQRNKRNNLTQNERGYQEPFQVP